ncbi:MAG TPA: hypothetical protein VFP61_04655 [Acidimicrobiales bacterium]|nr:hypothetical protein [Acidimicrobiales bacterium]
MSSTAVIRPAAGPTGARRAVAPLGSVRWQRAGRRPSAATYRRRRLAALGLAVLAGAGLWLVVHGLAGVLAGSAGAAPRPVAAHTWVVRPGDTAWGIALASGATGDIRPVVDAIEAQVGGGPLVVGERISLP